MIVGLLVGVVLGYALFNIRVGSDSNGTHLYYNTTKVDVNSGSWKQLF